MKKLIPLIFVLLFSLSTAFSQDLPIQAKIKPLKNNKSFSFRYDKFKDQTTVTFSGIAIKPSKTTRIYTYLDYYVNFSFKGQEIPEDIDSYYLVFKSTSRSWSFIDNRNLILLIDGEKLGLGQGDRDGEVNTGYGRYSSVSVSERVFFKVDRDFFNKIVNAKTVELQLGGFESEPLSEKQLLGFKDLLSASKK